MPQRLIASIALILAIAACASEATTVEPTTSVPSETPSTVLSTITETTSIEATTTSTVEVTATTSPPSGQASPGCVDGWVTPTPGTPLRAYPLDVIREYMGITSEFLVLEMRYFTGPAPPSMTGPEPPMEGDFANEIFERWYVKAQLVDDPAFRGRFLVHRFSPGGGITGAAPFDSVGYQSPDWHSFGGVDAGSANGAPHAVEGLPGLWSGYDYDTVLGEGGGGELPDEVLDCLQGT